MSPELSVVVPIHNEAESLEELHRELTATLGAWGRLYEIIVVDDGSTDESYEILARLQALDPHLRVIRFRRNFGQTAAFAAGFDHARGRMIVTSDGDLQNDPRDIPGMVAALERGFDIVCGWRKDRRDAFVSRRLPSMIANRLISWATGVRLHDYGCSLKVFRADIVKPLRLYGEMHRFIPVFAAMVGARITELPVNHRPRTYGKSKYSLSRTSRVMLDLITVKLLGSYSTKPIYFFGFAGFWLWVLALVLAVIVLVQKLLPPYPYAHNNPLLLLSVVLVIIGVQFILMGLLAELSVRTYHESQSKPTYVVREVIEKNPHRQPATNGRPAVRAR